MSLISPKVAVVILNWNGNEFLARFLPSVMASTYPGAEIWLADNASTDDSVEYAKSNFPGLRILAMDQNRGFAGGYNEALRTIYKETQASYFVLLNQDVEVEPDWIEPVIAQLESKPEIGAAQPKLRMEAQRNRFEYAGAAGGMIDGLGYPFCRGRIMDQLEFDQGQYDNQINIAWASGAALFIRAKLYLDLGGLDADFFAHMEEIDLCWRLRRAGYKIAYIPDSVVYHVGGGSLAKTNPQKTYLNFRNNLRMLIKNENSAKLLWLVPLRGSLDILAACKELAAGKTAHASAIIRGIFSVYSSMGYWISRRKEDHKKITAIKTGEDRSRKDGYYSGSIVLQYFLLGKKYWSEMKAD